MHLRCLVDTAQLSIVVTETISSRDGDNLPALRMAASTTYGMFGCRVSYRRIETQSVRVSRHFVNCIHKRCTDCRPITGCAVAPALC